MKNSLSLVVSLVVLGAFSSVGASELGDALKNGKVSGDISATFENRNVDHQVGKYYADTAYSVGSIGLNYETAKFNNFSANIGIRTYAPLWQNDSKYVTNHGIGDASERFYEDGSNKSVDLSSAYLAYETSGFSAKVGRQVLDTEWLAKWYQYDAISILIEPFKNAQIEMIYAENKYRFNPRYHCGREIINDNDGLYELGFSYHISDEIKAKVYGLTSPDRYDVYGGKVNYDTKINDVGLGIMTHYMETREDVAEDGKMLELVGYVSYAGYKATLGYVKTGKENGWGSAATYGDYAVWLEEGDHMYDADARTTYAMLTKTIADFSVTGMVGKTKYEKNSRQFSSNEFDVWASYNFTKQLSGALGFTVTKEDKNDGSIPDLTQINTTLTYKF